MTNNGKVRRHLCAATTCKRSWDIELNLAVKGTYKVLALQTPPPPFSKLVTIGDQFQFSRNNIEKGGGRGGGEGCLSSEMRDLYRKSHDLEYNSWLIGTSDFESSQNCTSLQGSAIWEFSKSQVPIIHELYEKVVWFFIYSTFNKITSFPWKLNRYSVQFGINCTALDQSKLSNFVEWTINTSY